MSANQQRETVSECISSGAEDYLVKPVTKREVQNIWTHVMRRLGRSAAAAAAAAALAAEAGGGASDAPPPEIMLQVRWWHHVWRGRGELLLHWQRRGPLMPLHPRSCSR